MLQTRAPDGMRGRVVSTQWSLALVATPLGVLGAGLLLEVAGPGPALMTVAAGMLATTLAAAATPALHHLDDPATDHAAPEEDR